MDADGQHRPDELSTWSSRSSTDEADYVQGSRYLGDYDDAGRRPRRRDPRLHRGSSTRRAGPGITDCTNGFRAIRAKSLARLRLEEPQFSAAEIIIESSRHGLRILEVPVHIQSRSHGESKKPRRLGYPIGFLGVILRTGLRHRGA